MRASIATAIIIFSTFSLATGQQSRGEVTTLTAEHDVSVGAVRFVVRGRNPCGAVRLNYGDGNAVTHAIYELPFSYTYDYTRVGDFGVSAEGMGNCDGVATSRIRVTAVRPQPAPPPPPPPVAAPPPPMIRFSPMDQNADGVITRAEWRGSAASFMFHDWNGNNQLEGNEVRFGAPRPGTGTGQISGTGKGNQAQIAQDFDWFDWSESTFRALDRNRDGRLSVPEWRYDLEHFVRVDRNGNSVLTLDEFLVTDIDDDRGDRFVNLDVNRNGRLEPGEWHGHAEVFRWLDRNADGVVARAEVASPIGANAGGQVPQGGGKSGQTGQTGQTGKTGGNVIGQGTAGGNARAVVVSGRQAWANTGIDVMSGDLVTIQATGTIQFSRSARDVAPPDGALGRAATAKAPLPDVYIGALIGRIGNGAPFLVGATQDSLRASHSGRLFLSVNDDVLSDNAGEFRVTVTVWRSPDR